MNSNILKKAVISEKSFAQADKSKVTFTVDKKATKDEIRQNIEELFKVNVLSVATAKIIGKIKRSKKGSGKRQDYKKAVITLKNGQKIDLFQIDEQKSDKKQDKKITKESTKKDQTDTKVTVREKSKK